MYPNLFAEKLLIIGGAEKAGTTALHTYLGDHPAVCPSSKKETDFFRQHEADTRHYLAFFDHNRPHTLRYLDSSPGYLAEAHDVAPRLAAFAPDCKIIFILRDPVARIKSAYRFYKNRLHLPASMGFDDYCQTCLAHDAGIIEPRAAALRPWHLRGLQRGRYEDLLKPFEAHFSPQSLLLIHYDDLQADSRRVAQVAARFAGLDPAFFDEYTIQRENVGFQVNRPWLQAAAIAVNDNFESFWRSHPKLKHSLMRAYKRVNAQPADADPLSADTSARLTAYYEHTAALMASLPRIPAA